MSAVKAERYAAYKDSGVEWLGEVPAHWEVRRVKEISMLVNGATPKSSVSENWDGELHWVTTDDLGKLSSKFITDTKRKITEQGYASCGTTICPIGSVVISGRAPIGHIGILSINASSNQGCKTLVLNQKIVNNIFIFYGLLSSKSKLEALGRGTTFIELSSKELGLFNLPLPSLLEQTAIAAYLDTKTAQIDRQIDLLSQKATQYGKLKQSLINETVTRGLDKSVPMKDSGVEWIGEVPEHWGVRRINDIAIQNKTKNSSLIETNLLSLSYGRIIRKDFNTSFGLLPESFETYQVVNEGTVILRLTDLQNDQRSLRVGHANERGIITSAYLGLVFNRSINSNFAYYLLHVYDLAKVFYWFGGGLRSTMRFDDIKVIPFVIPPLNEQKTIAKYLDEKTTQIDRIVTTINSQIDKQKALRKALINDVVTGKIKVVCEGEAV